MITYRSHHKRERYRPHSYRDGPSAPGENYSLLIRRDSDGDEDGGGGDGDGSGGNSPLRQGAGTETSVSGIRSPDGGGALELFMDGGFVIRNFWVKRRLIGEE